MLPTLNSLVDLLPRLEPPKYKVWFFPPYNVVFLTIWHTGETSRMSALPVQWGLYFDSKFSSVSICFKMFANWFHYVFFQVWKIHLHWWATCLRWWLLQLLYFLFLWTRGMNLKQTITSIVPGILFGVACWC